MFSMSPMAEISKEIIEIGKIAYSQGIISGCSGNISARYNQTKVLVTASGTHKGMLEFEDIISCDLGQKHVVEQHGRKISSEIKLHTFIYQNRPEVNAIIHAHPVYSIVASLVDFDFNKHLLPETVLSLGSIKIAKYATPTTSDLVGSIKNYVRKGVNNIVLERHGTLNIAPSLKTAFANLETMEHVAKISIIAKMIGCSDTLSETEIDKLIKIKSALFS